MQEHMVAGQDGIRSFVVAHPAIGVETGPPIICLHGLTRNGKDFRDLIEPLQMLGRRVFVMDVRGRGRSDRDPNPQNYNVLIYVQDVMAVMRALAIPRAVFIGTSMGGMITMILAAFAPNLVAGVVLNDIGPELSPVGIKRIQGYVGVAQKAQTWEEAGQRLMAIGDTTYPNRDLAFWIDMVQRNSIETPDGIAFDYDPAIAQAAPSAPDAPLPTLWDQYGALKNIPTACIRGGLSDLLTRETVAKMAEVKPDLVVAEVNGVGHAPMLSEPEAWAAIEAIVAQTC